MTTAHLVNGWNVSDGGANTVDKLKPYLNGIGLSTLDHDYSFPGIFPGLVQVRFGNTRVAESVFRHAHRGDIGIGHSNGACILAQAALMGAPLTGLVLINPALDEDFIVAPQVKWIHVYHSHNDYAVWFAKLLRFRHPWGAMGRVGFKGTDPRYTNVDYTPFGHSDVFQHLDGWGPRIADAILREHA
jgi:hypothetical protein